MTATGPASGSSTAALDGALPARELVRVSSETAVISGVSSGDPIVSLGAHLLHEGVRVRTAAESGGE